MKKSIFKTAVSTLALTIAFSAVSVGTSVYASPPPAMPDGKGDINGDGYVDYVDTILIRDYIDGVIKEFPNPGGFEQADVSSDGKIGSEDGVYFMSAPRLNYGDLNDDGKLNSIDLLLMQRGITGPPEVPDPRQWRYLRDLNGDGKVNSLDLFIFKRFILGIIPELPITKYVIPKVPDGMYP